MQATYMKIAIYVLTFLTYAYSGYGSNTLAHLRDAIIAAEAIFGDVFKNLITVAKKFRTVHEVFDAAVEETCIFKCPTDNGGQDIRPLQNKLYTPTADGCGSLGLRISTEYLPAAEMEVCCNEHDICYDTCNSDKELCDLDFKRCLYKYCDSYEKSIASDLMIKGCKAAAKMLFTGTLTLGCKSYLDSQQRSCYCPPAGNRQRDDKNYHKSYHSNGDKHYGKNKKQKYGWKDPNEV
ncbi:group XIIB secretory phospholipase A2-like protein [Glossina fuscipes]|uniref:Group XIIB secretory phospholipase A2-like protein n=1 Tax=Glossina fuscipes TaxID=7396 RepID=A0A8U0W3J6_9MUSC|nr:group XIIB secretory phospholipase A2-like protein [Glossina fuscipes]